MRFLRGGALRGPKPSRPMSEGYGVWVEDDAGEVRHTDFLSMAAGCRRPKG